MAFELNLFALEPVLLDALRAALPDNVKVASGANLVGRQNLAGLCPAVLVTPAESSPRGADDDPAADDALTVEEEVWTVTALVEFVRDRHGLTADFSEAGELLGRAYSALQGLSADSYRTLVYIGRQPPAPTAEGFCECSIDFTVTRAFAPVEP